LIQNFYQSFYNHWKIFIFHWNNKIFSKSWFFSYLLIKKFFLQKMKKNKYIKLPFKMEILKHCSIILSNFQKVFLVKNERKNQSNIIWWLSTKDILIQCIVMLIIFQKVFLLKIERKNQKNTIWWRLTKGILMQSIIILFCFQKVCKEKIKSFFHLNIWKCTMKRNKFFF
jgi:hypothetical protein